MDKIPCYQNDNPTGFVGSVIIFYQNDNPTGFVGSVIIFYQNDNPTGLGGFIILSIYQNGNPMGFVREWIQSSLTVCFELIFSEIKINGCVLYFFVFY
ncbi:MAG: hypothetical protein JNL70_17330 [Saprospiraceae bacterium]|nr:hypothetical protein [Saprospiraceae bacterium]